MNFTIVIPFYNGNSYIDRLVSSIPSEIPIIIVDDRSTEPYQSNREYRNIKVISPERKGYFTGAVNVGIAACAGDVLVLNQDAYFSGPEWLDFTESKREEYAMFGERIAGDHPAFLNGYIHGTFMYIRRDAITAVGLLNAEDYPLWGSTCEYQLRVARAGFRVLPARFIPGFVHQREGRFGSAINAVLKEQPDKKDIFIRTPPEVSVIVSCFNHGKYLPDLINSLIGGNTNIGEFPAPTFQSFEIVIVDDGSTDDTWEWCQALHDPYKAIRVFRKKNGGTSSAHNAGVKNSYGRFITVIGADDMREPGSLEALYKAQLKNPHSFIYDGILAFAGTKRRPDIIVGVSAFDFERLLYKNHIHAGIMLPRKAWLEVGGWPEVMRDGREDWAMNVNLGIHGWCGVYLPKPGYLYRREKQNRTLKNTTPAHMQNS